MNRILFYSLLIFLVLSITLGAIYFLNMSNMNEIRPNNTSIRETTDGKISDPVFENIIPDQVNPKSGSNQTIKSTLKNQDLFEIEKELNNLDLSSEADIE